MNDMMSIEKKVSTVPKSTRSQLLNEMVPHVENFLESREEYIKALEMAISALKSDNQKATKTNRAIQSSIEELVAIQQLSNAISTAVDPEAIVTKLIDLTKTILPLQDSNIFLFETSTTKLIPLSKNGSPKLLDETLRHIEAGIVDWVIAEKRTVVIPDLNSLVANGSTKIFVIVPLLIRDTAIGLFVIRSIKRQGEFSNQDIQTLSILANQAAVGVENWRTHEKVIHLNEELLVANAQTLKAAKLAALGELSASIVHEIKNPVQVIMMHMDMVERGKPLPNWQELLRQQVGRLSEITRRLMNFSRDVSEGFEVSAVDVNRGITETVAIVEHEYKGDNIQIEQELAEDLPPVSGNLNHLQQVFLNLLINARDAMPEGGKIRITTSVEGKRVIARVSDSGVGMSKEVMEKAFAAFYTTKREGKGTGLGLSICRKIVANHNGEITVESEVGKGTTFSVSFPIFRKLS